MSTLINRAQEAADYELIDKAVADTGFREEADEIRQALSRDDLTPQQRDALHAQQRRLYAERFGERELIPGRG